MSIRPWLAVLCLALPVAAADGPAWSFAPPEHFRLDWDTHGLRIADVNGDKLNDIVLFNNARARIECLLQRAPGAPVPPRLDAEPNELPSSARFESRPLLAEKKIFALEVGDLNKDGRTDLVYYGDPRELVVVYQDAKGQWGARRTFDIADGATNQGAIGIGDLNGDGREDIALLGHDCVYFVYQNAQGKLDAPVREAGAPDGAFAVIVKDFNGDKRQDIVYFCSSESAPLCFRFQGADGRLGPEVRCKAPGIRGLATADIDGDGAEELIAIQMTSGRMVIYKHATEASAGGLLDGALERYAFTATGGRRPRVIALAPFTDPKRPDILSADPDAAEVELFIQARPGQWSRRLTFPSLQGVTDIAAADLDGDGRPEALLLSPDESTLGLARVEPGGRVAFPRALPITGKPVCMAVADLDADGRPEILYVSSTEKERALCALDGRTFAEKWRLPVVDARTDPDGLLVVDMNKDGLPDIVLFTPFQEMRVFKGAPEGKFVDVSRGPDYGKGLVQGARLKAAGLADVDGDGKPELLLAAKNFARALRLDEKDRLQVIDQLNGRSPTSQIVAVAGARLNGGKGADEVVLVDTANRCLTALRRNAIGTYEIVDHLAVAAAGPERFIAGDLTGEGRASLLMLGPNDFTLMRPGAARTALREMVSYETPVRNGRLDGIAVGDLGGTKGPEFLVSESTKSALELLTVDVKNWRLTRAMSWPVFEMKTLGGRTNRGNTVGPEPREFDIADVTGDGKADIVLLVHDRVIVYAQD